MVRNRTRKLSDGEVMLLGVLRGYGRGTAARSALADWIAERLPAMYGELRLYVGTRSRIAHIDVRHWFGFDGAEEVQVDLHLYGGSGPGYRHVLITRPFEDPGLAATVAEKLAEVYRR